MPDQLKYWTHDELEVFIRDLLDALKTFDEQIVKDWVAATWEDPDEIYT